MSESTTLDFSIADLISKEVVKIFESVDIEQIVKQQVEAVIEKNIRSYTQRLHTGFNVALENIIQNMESELDERVRAAARNAVAQTDIPHLIKRSVRNLYEEKIQSYDFPTNSIAASAIKWKDISFSGDMVNSGTIKNFGSTGIKDNATDVKLILNDNELTVESTLIAKEVHTAEAEIGNLTVRGTLAVTGDFAITEALSEMLASVSTIAINEYFAQGFELGEKSILNNGKLLLNSTTLGPSIVNSNIRKLGLLQNLRVQGDSEFSDTMIIGENGRVGINTDSPEGALTVWDEDSEVTFSKSSRRVMRLGSTRDGELILGAANKDQLHIKNDSVEINEPLRLMGVKFSVLNYIPDFNGEPGEVVYHRSATLGQPVLYICQGGNNWAAVNVKI